MPPVVIYLDQNKWIDLARCVKDPDKYAENYAVLEILVRQVQKHAAIVPLSFTNIYETHKINDLGRRQHLAWVQSALSRGIVFRGRNGILRPQIADYLRSSHSMSPINRPHNWFLSDLHFESAADYNPEIFGFSISNRVLTAFKANPAGSLYDYLVHSDENVRRDAIRRYSTGSRDLLNRMEKRLELWTSESIAFRKRAYGAILVIEHVDLILSIAKELKLTVSTINDLGSSRIKAIVDKVPTFDIERELAIKMEAESRSIDENDLRDISALYTVLPYADIIVGEQAIINRARQAKLGQRYKTKLFTKITELAQGI